MASENESSEYSEPAETLGEYLGRHREASGKSLDDISRATRVSKRYLLAFESDDVDNYPESPFDRGFLRNYALEIGLDAGECLDRFDRFKKASMPTQIRDIKKLERPVSLGAPAPQTETAQWVRLAAIVAGFLLLLTLGLVWISKSSKDETAKAPEVEVLPDGKAGSGGQEIQRLDTPSLPANPPNVVDIEAQKKATLLIRIDSLAEQEILLDAGQTKQIEFRNKVSIDGKDRGFVKLKLNGEGVATKDQAGPTVLYNPARPIP